MKWRLKNDVGLVVRCEYDALLPTPQGRSTYINIKALNEWDPKVRAGNEGGWEGEGGTVGDGKERERWICCSDLLQSMDRWGHPPPQNFFF